MMDVDVSRFASRVELARAAANDWLAMLPASANSAHLVALSGGRVAGAFFDAVTERAVGSDVSFRHVHFFWSDERCVPPEHRESNFGLARKELLGPLGVEPDRIHRIRGEWKPELAVVEANTEIGLIAPANDNGLPVLDLVFLGMGEDGHTASLFPNAPAAVVECQLPYLAARSSSKPPPMRVSLSYAAIAAARQVWVLVSGPGKEAVFHQSLTPDATTPLARILRSRARTRIFTDIDAKPDGTAGR